MSKDDDINTKIKKSDKLLLAGSGWQLLFIDNLSSSDADAKRERVERKYEDFKVDILAIYNCNGTKQAFFALRYVISLTGGGRIEAKDVYDDTHPVLIGDKIVDAKTLNFLYWPLPKTMKTALDEKLQTVAAGWMVTKYRNADKNNTYLLDDAKNKLTAFLDTNFNNLTANIPQ